MNIKEIQKDWKTLDNGNFDFFTKDLRLVSHQSLNGKFAEGLPPVEEMTRGHISRMFSAISIVSDIIWAFNILWRSDKKTVILANGSSPIGNYLCLLNHFLFRGKHKILFWDSHIEPKSRFKKYFARRCFLGCSLATFWSRKQIKNYAKYFNLPETKLIFIPYKANHSQWKPRKNISLGYVFSGGNTKRDYKTLVDSVKNTDVRLIISATNPSVKATIEDIPNVIPLAATEPSFAKLMASSKFVVIPMRSTGLKGAGEANFCNAMWHGKPLIAMDDISAEDYVVEGETGYVTSPGNVEQLRKKILELWNDNEKCAYMGNNNRKLVNKYYTHDLCMRRIIRLACLLIQEI